MRILLLASAVSACSPAGMQGFASFVQGYQHGQAIRQCEDGNANACDIAAEQPPRTLSCRSYHVLGLGDPIQTDCQ